MTGSSCISTRTLCLLLAVAGVRGSWRDARDKFIIESQNRAAKAQQAFLVDPTLVGLMNGCPRSLGVADFFRDVQTVLRENPDLFSLANTPETLRSVRRGDGCSDLPFELAEAVVEQLDTPVLMNGEQKPLRACISRVPDFTDPVSDFKVLLMYSSRLDHVQRVQRTSALRRLPRPLRVAESVVSTAAVDWPSLRWRWIQAVRGNPNLLMHFQEAMARYRAVTLLLRYDDGICGDSDARVAARMKAQAIHAELKRLSYLV